MTKDLSWLRQLPGSPLIVAEIKQCSPYGWENPLWIQPQLEICEAVGDIISVHTDPLWGGSWEHLAEIRALTSKPILAKGFHPTVPHVQRALDIGADWVLTVDWWPGDYTGSPELVELGKRCWFETCSYDEARETKAERVVINARNPRTGQVYGPAPWDVRRDHRKGWLCQASCIRGPQDVVPSIDAILIGEGLYQ